jgi:hypothetical protein
MQGAEAGANVAGHTMEIMHGPAKRGLSTFIRRGFPTYGLDDEGIMRAKRSPNMRL